MTQPLYYKELQKHLLNYLETFKIKQPISIVSGTASGMDKYGEQLAKEFNLETFYFPANWKQFGKGAGPIRNQQMVDFADGALILCFENSAGSMDLFRRANGEIDTMLITYKKE